MSRSPNVLLSPRRLPQVIPRSPRTLLLCLGNSSLLGGIDDGVRPLRPFRRPPHDFPPVRGRFDRIALCSVVPTRTAALVAWCETRLQLTPLVLTARNAPGLTVGYRQPAQLGTDRLAAALGARARHPGKNLILVDCGTATTVTALRRDGHLLGGAIFPGLALWPEMLATRTAQLPLVKIPARPRRTLGRSPAEGIAAGVYFGHLGAVRELVARLAAEAFGRREFLVLGTGGHAPVLLREGLVTALEPTLVLDGLRTFANHAAS